MRKSEVLFLLAGVSLGAVAGLLLAPEKGEKTREKIAGKAGDLKKEIEEKSAELKKEISKRSAELKKELDEQVEISKSKISKFADNVAAPLKEKLKANGVTETKEA